MKLYTFIKTLHSASYQNKRLLKYTRPCFENCLLLLLFFSSIFKQYLQVSFTRSARDGQISHPQRLLVCPGGRLEERMWGWGSAAELARR